jgi:hypothetical protein
MPSTTRRSSRPSRRAKPLTMTPGADEHEHEPGSILSTFTYRGKSVEVHGGEKGCCVVIDGERIDYMIEPDGIYSHEMAYQKFGSPEELAEEVIRQWGQAKIARTPVPHDHDH